MCEPSTNHDHGSSPVTITSFLMREHGHEPRSDRGLLPHSSFSSWLVAFASMLASLESRARMHHYGALLMHKN